MRSARVDSVLAENAEPLKSTIANLKIFTEGLAKNTGGLDSIVAGLVKMTGGGEAAVPKTIYDLGIPAGLCVAEKAAQGAARVADADRDPDARHPALPARRRTRSFRDSPNAQWADSIPKMLQIKLIQSFENYDVAHAPLRATDNPGTNFQLLLDLRSFQINTDPEPAAEIEFSARILNKDGQVVASHLFQQSKKLDKSDPASAVAAFDGAFASIATELIAWTAGAL